MVRLEFVSLVCGNCQPVERQESRRIVGSLFWVRHPAIRACHCASRSRSGRRCRYPGRIRLPLNRDFGERIHLFEGHQADTVPSQESHGSGPRDSRKRNPGSHGADESHRRRPGDREALCDNFRSNVPTLHSAKGMQGLCVSVSCRWLSVDPLPPRKTCRHDPESWPRIYSIGARPGLRVNCLNLLRHRVLAMHNRPFLG